MKIKVVIGAGEPVYAEGLRSILAAEADIDVVGVAHNGEDCITHVEHHKPHVAVVHTGMPGFTGAVMVKTLKEVSPETEILGLARKIKPPCLFEILEAGVCGCLLKHASPQEILLGVRSASAGKSVMDLSALRVLSSNMDKVIEENNSKGNGSKMLNARELQILKLTSNGLHSKEMARRLNLSERSIQACLASIFRKFVVSSRSQAVIYALKTGWLDLNDITISSI